MAAENEIKEQQAAGQKFDWKKLISHPLNPVIG